MGKISFLTWLSPPRWRLAHPLLLLKSVQQFSLLITFVFVCTWTAPTHSANPEQVPESASGLSELQTARGHTYMAVTANKHATAAANEILAKGGSAIDAAIAAQLVLGLVEPQSSGIGGGAFLVYYEAKNKKVVSYDGRETAPAAVNESHFLVDGKPMGFFDALIGGHAVGTPGVLSMLQEAHQQQGRLDWEELFAPAIKLADEGFAVSPRLNHLLDWIKTLPGGVRHSAFKHYFYGPDGEPWPVGHILKNPAYTATLRLLAIQGADGFYRGKLANHIVSAVQRDEIRPGKITRDDLINYRAQRNHALCGPYLHYTICGAPPPSSGTTTVLAILGMLQHQAIAPNTDVADFYHLFSEASKLAFADRNTFIADPAFVKVPTRAMLAPDYLANRGKLIQGDSSLKNPGPGQPQQADTAFIYAESPELPSTSHLSIVDARGDIVSMTTSIEMAFGSRILVDGYLLNNQLTDFSFTPSEGDTKVANRIQPGKRPRSSMSPLIIFDQAHQPVLVIGSPGGARIIDYVARVIAQTLAMQQPLPEAIAAAHIVDMDHGLELEENKVADSVVEKLRKLGHSIKFKEQTSGLHAIEFSKEGMLGIADPRREGAAQGK